MAQTFTEHYQPPYSTVSILKRMNRFKPMMKIYNILKCGMSFRIIFLQKSPHLLMYIFRSNRVITTYFIGQHLIFTDTKPILTLVGCPRF